MEEKEEQIVSQMLNVPLFSLVLSIQHEISIKKIKLKNKWLLLILLMTRRKALEVPVFLQILVFFLNSSRWSSLESPVA